MSARYPLAALVAASGLTESALARRVGLSGSTLKAARERGLVERAADRYAVRAGLHPAQVWDDWIDGAGVTCPECGSRFVPLRKSHRYCTQDCYQRRYKREKYRARYATDAAFRARELEKSRRYRHETAPAVRDKQRAYYRANRHLWVEGRRRRRERADPRDSQARGATVECTTDQEAT